MILKIDPSTISEEEIRTRLPRNCGLDPPNRLCNGPELKRTDARGSEERSEHHVISRGNAHNIIIICVYLLDKPAPGPARTQNHHSGFLVSLGRLQSRGIVLRAGAEMAGQ